ncbi:autotransporter outer membrane beta-barrel domain-containing protein [Herbaspirillum sp. RTI4]|uniref:autotransporter family protein n=2 Tax=Herbaspirillum sp. RTI4 TaxID=3048640 RepID=UPI003A102A6F
MYGTMGTITNTGTIAGNIKYVNGDLNIVGGTGTTMGTLTGNGGTIGLISNYDLNTNINFISGNTFLNDAIYAGSKTVNNIGAALMIKSRITITGSYSQGAGASLIVDVEGNNPATDGVLLVSGAVTLTPGSGIKLVRSTGGIPFVAGDKFAVLISPIGTGSQYNVSSLVITVPGWVGGVTAEHVTTTGAGGQGALRLSLGTTPPVTVLPSVTPDAGASLNGVSNYNGINQGLLDLNNLNLAIIAGALTGGSALENKLGAQLSPAASAVAATQASASSTQAVLSDVSAHIGGLRSSGGSGSSGSSGSSASMQGAGQQASADLNNMTALTAGSDLTNIPGLMGGARSSDSSISKSTGEQKTGSNAVWGHVFGGQSTQNMRQGVSGYQSGYNGLLIGADAPVMDQFRFGGLVSYANTSVASRDDNSGSGSHVTSYGVIGYASYSGDPWYIDVSGGVVQHEYTTQRVINVANYLASANGQYNGIQTVASVQAGYPLKLNAGGQNLTLTPLTGLTYSTLRSNGYTETGTSGAELSVDAAKITSIKSDLGAQVASDFDTEYGVLTPSAQLVWRREYRTKGQQSVSSFAVDNTGVTKFTGVGPTSAANTAVVTLGAALLHRQNLTLTAKYTAEKSSGYLAQTVGVHLRYLF